MNSFWKRSQGDRNFVENQILSEQRKDTIQHLTIIIKQCLSYYFSNNCKSINENTIHMAPPPSILSQQLSGIDNSNAELVEIDLILSLCNLIESFLSHKLKNNLTIWNLIQSILTNNKINNNNNNNINITNSNNSNNSASSVSTPNLNQSGNNINNNTPQLVKSSSLSFFSNIATQLKTSASNISLSSQPVKPKSPEDIEYWSTQIDCVQSLSEVNTDIGRFRALLRRALNESTIRQLIDSIALNNDILRNHYEEDAMLRNKEDSDIFRSMLASLDPISFDIDFNDPKLNNLDIGDTPLSIKTIDNTTTTIETTTTTTTTNIQNLRISNENINNDSTNEITTTTTDISPSASNLDLLTNNENTVIRKKKIIKSLTRTIDLDIAPSFEDDKGSGSGSGGVGENNNDPSSTNQPNLSTGSEKVIKKKIVKRIIKTKVQNNNTSIPQNNSSNTLIDLDNNNNNSSININSSSSSSNSSEIKQISTTEPKEVIETEKETLSIIKDDVVAKEEEEEVQVNTKEEEQVVIKADVVINGDKVQEVIAEKEEEQVVIKEIAEIKIECIVGENDEAEIKEDEIKINTVQRGDEQENDKQSTDLINEQPIIIGDELIENVEEETKPLEEPISISIDYASLLKQQEETEKIEPTKDVEKVEIKPATEKVQEVKEEEVETEPISISIDFTSLLKQEEEAEPVKDVELVEKVEIKPTEQVLVKEEIKPTESTISFSIDYASLLKQYSTENNIDESEISNIARVILPNSTTAVTSTTTTADFKYPHEEIETNYNKVKEIKKPTTAAGNEQQQQQQEESESIRFKLNVLLDSEVEEEYQIPEPLPSDLFLIDEAEKQSKNNQSKIKTTISPSLDALSIKIGTTTTTTSPSSSLSSSPSLSLSSTPPPPTTTTTTTSSIKIKNIKSPIERKLQKEKSNNNLSSSPTPIITTMIDNYSNEDNVLKRKEEEKLDQKYKKEIHAPRKRLHFIIHNQSNVNNNKCAGCNKDISGLFSKSRYCEYSGKYFCSTCHDKSLYYIPSRMVYNFDFKKYPIAKVNLEFLQSIEKDPLIDLFTLNSQIYKNQIFLKIRNLRKQMFHLKEFLLTCGKGGRELYNISIPNGEVSYLANDIELFSIYDLVNHKGLWESLRYLVAKWLDHVETCLLCNAKGSICQFCNSDTPIYPYHISTVSQCQNCKSISHKSCYQPIKCPKCIRLATARLNKSKEQQQQQQQQLLLNLDNNNN